jgi:hypothetical protein
MVFPRKKTFFSTAETCDFVSPVPYRIRWSVEEVLKQNFEARD